MTSTYTYDDAGRLTFLEHITATGSLAGYEYALDQVGNRTTLTETLITVRDLPEGTYLESGGQVVMEAEHFGRAVTTTTQSWLTATAQSGYTGTAYLHALPDLDALYQTNDLTGTPRLDYPLDLTTPGTYTVWLRGYASNAAGDSVYVGLNGQVVSLTGLAPNAWGWARTTTSGVTATLPITTTGLQTISVWMREDGLRLDRLLLTTDTTYIPTGFGPTETPRLLANRLIVPLDRTIVYTYDNLYRLTDADYSTGELYEYDYDPVGNRLEQIINGDTTTYTYDDANRLEQATHQSTVVSYQFDDNGNLLKTGVLTNAFDAANRLTSTVRAEISPILPQYNGIGDQVAQTVAETTVYYALDVVGLPEVIQTSEGNSYLHLPGVIMAESAEGEVRYLLSDGLGSIRQAVDETAEVVSYDEYDPYGNPLTQHAPRTTPYGYTGEWWEAEIGLLHLRARWYLPETGTFVSRDPWEGDKLRPQTLNGWGYVEGNPIRYTDPSGHCIVQYSGEVRMGQAPYGTSGLCPYTETPGMEAAYQVTAVSNTLRDSWNPFVDPLTPEQWNLAKQEARRFGLPKELVAATVAAEIVFDTDFHDKIPNASVATVGAIADFAYSTRDWPLFNLCYAILEGFHEYFGLAPYLEPKGIGYGVAPGLAHIHAGPAVRTENYINQTYPGQNLMPDLGPENQEGVRLRTLLSDEGNIRYAAAYLRWMADLRTGSISNHTTDLTDTDMVIIYTVYRCNIKNCYGTLEDFQNAQTPSPDGSPNDFAVFLPLYKNKP